MALATDEGLEASAAQREAALHSLRSARRSKGPVISWTSQAYKIGGRNYVLTSDNISQCSIFSIALRKATQNSFKHFIT